MSISSLPPFGLHFLVSVQLTPVSSLLTCAIYYWFWAFLLPKWKGYRLRQELISLDDGAQSNKLRKVPISEVDEWDATHDAAGRLLGPSAGETLVQEKGLRTSSEGSSSDEGKQVSSTIRESSHV